MRKIVSYYLIFLFASLYAINATAADIKIECDNLGYRINPVKDEFAPGDTVHIDFVGFNDSDEFFLKDISKKGEPVLMQTTGESISWTIPENTPSHAIGIYSQNRKGEQKYLTFFRIMRPGMLSVYAIEKQNINGIPVYKLDGGMSAEYAVQKSLSNITGGISHTWKIGPGGGPSPVWGTPRFLRKSIENTVELYNKEFGKKTPIETVIISTGVPSVPYLSGTLNAPVLPLHYLVSVNACKEIQTILSQASQDGYKSYATLGYDASMADVGVAWVKLLDLPREYKKFLKDHKVKNVIICGVGEDVHGESCARRIVNNANAPEYSVEDVYIQYTNHGSEFDMKSIRGNIVDYDNQPLDSVRMIADWESGILNQQISNFARSIGNSAIRSYVLVSPDGMMDMYNLSHSLMLTMLKKNNKEPQGIVFNEYLISEPVYEWYTGKIPLLYWQFVPAALTVARLDNRILPEIVKFYPQFSLKEKNIHLNARIGKRELEKELNKRGYACVTKRLDNVEELWDETDGMNAPCEFIYSDMVQNIGGAEYRKIVSNRKCLTIDDLQVLAEQIPGIHFEKMNTQK